MFVRSTIQMARNTFYLAKFFTLFNTVLFSSNRTIVFQKQIALFLGHDTASMKLYRKLVKISLNHFLPEHPFSEISYQKVFFPPSPQPTLNEEKLFQFRNNTLSSENRNAKIDHRWSHISIALPLILTHFS